MLWTVEEGQRQQGKLIGHSTSCVEIIMNAMCHWHIAFKLGVDSRVAQSAYHRVAQSA